MTFDELNEAQIKAIFEETNLTISELEKTMEDRDYSVYTDAEANEAVKEYIKESAWAFNADFILEQCELPFSGADSLKNMCESANDFILALIEKTCGIDEFCDAAVSTNGRGNFLASYDGNEIEISTGKDTIYLYRNN